MGRAIGAKQGEAHAAITVGEDLIGQLGSVGAQNGKASNSFPRLGRLMALEPPGYQDLPQSSSQLASPLLVVVLAQGSSTREEIETASEGSRTLREGIRCHGTGKVGLLTRTMSCLRSIGTPELV